MKLKILILMTVSVLFLTAHLLVIPVWGMENDEIMMEDELIIIEGKVEEAYYQKDGYVIIENRVNSEAVGSYEIIYQSLADGTLYTRKVEVISRDKSEYFKIDTYTIESLNDYPMCLEKSISINENEQLLLIKYITNQEKELGHLYMYYVKNNEIVQEIQLFYNQIVEVNDLILDGEDFVIIGKIWNSLYANYDIVFVVIDQNGFRKISKIIGGTSTDVGISGFVTEENYLIGGVTDSTDKEFLGNKKTNGFVMKIDKNSYEVVKVEYNKDYLMAKDLRFLNLDKNIGLLLINDDSLVLTMINDSILTVKEKMISFPNMIDVRMIKVIDGQINIVLEIEDKIEIGTIDFKGYHKKNNIDNNLEIVSIDYTDKILNVLYKTTDGYQFVVFDEELNRLYEKDINQTFDSSTNLFIQNKVITEEAEKEINIYKLSYFKVLSIGKNTIDNNNYHNYDIIMNGRKIEHDEELTKDNVDLSTFGNYEITYYFDQEMDVIIQKVLKVNSICDIEKDGLYDVGLIINHNGTMFLNNEKIESGYMIEEPGEYVLELIGNNASKIINFEVEKLSIEGEKPQIKDEIWVDTKILTDTYLEEKITYDFIPNSQNLESQVDHKFDWMYMIPVLLTMGLGFLVVKTKY